MADFYEIDFLEVHSSKSGDALTIRYELLGMKWIHVVDAGYASTGESIIAHIDKYYDKPTYIDHVIVTHPDKDHAEGIPAILENYAIGCLWVLFPWNYVDETIDRFARYTNKENLKNKLRKAYPYLSAIEEVVERKNITVREPFQGASIGMFKVLTPSKQRYLDLVVTSAKTPAYVEDSAAATVMRYMTEAARAIVEKIKAAWGEEYFPGSGTSNENEMSVVQFARLCGQNIVLTADSGRDGLTEAADYASIAGLSLPGGIDKMQIPHHGGRHNVSTDLLDRWLGEKLATMPTPGRGKFTAVVSAAKEDPDHPRDAVVRGFIHRGANVLSTDDASGGKRVSCNAPSRGWGAAVPLPYPTDMES